MKDEVPSAISSGRRALLAFGAAVLPFGMFAAYLLVTRSGTPRFTIASDYLAFAIATAVGATCLWRWVRGAHWRLSAMVVYALACSATLFISTFWFLCAVFDECL